MVVLKILTIILLFSFSLEDCHKNCETCYDYSNDYEDMKCIKCKENLSLIVNTSNCVDLRTLLNYYLNATDKKLYPCSLFKESNCYECNPYLNTSGICLSCNRGYIYNKETKECKKCGQNEYPIIINDFDGCSREYKNTFCEKYITYCRAYQNNGQVICVIQAPIFDYLAKTCNEFECENSNLKKDICYPLAKKYIDRILFISWFNNEPKYLKFPNYYIDNSFLLIEVTCELPHIRTRKMAEKTNKRRFYFFNEEGRGLFNPINDDYERLAEFEKKNTRILSTGIGLKTNGTEGYRYYLNFENFNYNMELYDLKTGKISYDNIFEIAELNQFFRIDYLSCWIQLLKLKEENRFLVGLYVQQFFPSNNTFAISLLFILYEYNQSDDKEINLYSFKKINLFSFNKVLFSPPELFDFNEYTRFYIIQTKKGDFWFSAFSMGYTLMLFHGVNLGQLDKYYRVAILTKEYYHKLVFLKDEKFLLCYFLNNTESRLKICDFREEDRKLIYLQNLNIRLEAYEGGMQVDIIALNGERIVFVVPKWHGKRITIFIIDFFDNYQQVFINKIYLNIYDQKMEYSERYSLAFKYKDIVGLHFENIEGRTGFILFGYYNSTDPKHIYNIKKDGLNYEIILQNYLTLQTNIFNYEKKCIKIIEIPNTEESGLYLISNIRKNVIKKGDCVDLNTKISLNFVYNGIIKKGNYLFKFCGVLQEPKYENLSEFSDTLWSSWTSDLNEKYISMYNERINTNITGKVALLQINVLNDTQIFCDDKYNATSLRNEEGEYITCGFGKFYDVDNANEITQKHLGSKYYFNSNKNEFIKCHEKCKRCSKAYNDTNMNCDECFDNFFLRDGICLEISKCDYNYYYDNDLKLICIDRDKYCPDIKPFEDKITKECIEKCDINDLNNNICSPTNNPVSINKTEKLLLSNVKFLNLEEKLLKNKEKYAIIGNNISFIFSTSEIEKKELYENLNSSSIILNECENILKNNYFIPENIPIVILKKETMDSNSNNLDIYYETLNPQNLSQILEINLCKDNFIEIRLPLVLKKYKMDLVLKASSLGYNIFDLNDPFYHDICSVFTYNDSDFSLSERRNLLDLTDENLCLINCNFSSFDIKTIRTTCICLIGNNFNNSNFSSIININNDENNKDNSAINIFEQKFEFSKASNLEVVKCVSIIFRKNLFTDNYGFYIMLSMTIINIILIIFSPINEIETKLRIFCLKVILQMKTIYYKIHEEEKTSLINNKETEYDNNDNNKIENELNIDDFLIRNRNEIAKKVDINLNSLNSEEKSSRNFGLISSSESKLNKVNNSLNYLKINKNDEKTKEKKDEENTEKIIKELKNKNNSDYYIYYIIKYVHIKIRRLYLSESEVENLSYIYALKIENRHKSDFYFSLLAEKNKLISIFISKNDYNIKTIKISLFIFNFNLSLTINALFFNDEAIYEINQDEGSFNLSTQIKRILYSTIISTIISVIVGKLALTHNDIIKLRFYKAIKDAKNNISPLIQKLKIKIIIFFGIIIFFDIIFLYYISAFCAIYSIIQVHLISDSLMSFLLTLSYSIILSMIVSIMRITSLKRETKARYVLYMISWILSLV